MTHYGILNPDCPGRNEGDFAVAVAVQISVISFHQWPLWQLQFLLATFAV
jgi:hypothetical protein